MVKARGLLVSLSYSFMIGIITHKEIYVDPGIVETPQVSGPWSVDKVLATISPTPPAEGTDSPIPYFHILERLKTNKREGWRRFNIGRYLARAYRLSCF